MEVVQDSTAIAQSLHRLAGRMSTLEDFSWDGMSYEDQLRWLRLAVAGPKRLLSMEGQSLQTAGRAMQEVFLNGDDPSPASSPHDAVFWEMIARQLWVLMDCDEPFSPESLEKMLAEQFKKKVGNLSLSAK